MVSNEKSIVSSEISPSLYFFISLPLKSNHTFSFIYSIENLRMKSTTVMIVMMLHNLYHIALVSVVLIETLAGLQVLGDPIYFGRLETDVDCADVV